jgi:hypothetical protein
MSTAAASPGFVCKLKDRKEVAEGTMAFRLERPSGLQKVPCQIDRSSQASRADSGRRSQTARKSPLVYFKMRTRREAGRFRKAATTCKNLQ